MLNDYIKIGSKIKKLRKEIGISQKEMAELLEIPRSSYSNYENNNRVPDNYLLERIVFELGVGSFELIYGVDDSEDLSELVSRNIKKYRKAKELKQYELAKLIGIPTSTLANYETGRREPNLKTISKLAKGLGINRIKLLANIEGDLND